MTRFTSGMSIFCCSWVSCNSKSAITFVVLACSAERRSVTALVKYGRMAFWMNACKDSNGAPSGKDMTRNCTLRGRTSGIAWRLIRTKHACLGFLYATSVTIANPAAGAADSLSAPSAPSVSFASGTLRTITKQLFAGSSDSTNRSRIALFDFKTSFSSPSDPPIT